MQKTILSMAFALVAAPAFADGHLSTKGNADVGEVQFNRQCQACHVVRNNEGEVLAGRSARTGPNLYGIPGQLVGNAGDFRYGKSITQVGETDLTWTEDLFVTYVQDPTGWLRGQLDDSRARSKMAYQVRTASDAFDLYAYLSNLSAQ